jgi:Skp family chaperone for outer membrane proteins
MKFRTWALTGLIGAVAVAGVGAASAQTKVFVIDEQKIRTESKIGKDIESKLGAIKTEGVEKLGLEQLQKDIKAEEDRLQPKVASLTPEAIQKDSTLKGQVEALNKKRYELSQKAGVLNANLEQQSSAASLAFASALAPAVDTVAKEVGADVVLSVSSTWFVKNTVDVSQKIIARLDATTPSYAAFQAAQPKPATPAPRQP